MRRFLVTGASGVIGRNTEGTRRALEGARAAKVGRFVFSSSIKAMSREELDTPEDANGQPRPWNETDAIEPDTPYGKSKLAAEKLVLHGGYIPEPVVLRLCMVYGVGTKGNLQKMLWAVNGGKFPPLPEVRNRRSMVGIRDAVQAALLAVNKSEAIGQVFIVSDGHAYSTRQVYELMCLALNRSIPRWTLPISAMRALGLLGDIIGTLRRRRFVFDSVSLAKLIGSAWFSAQKIERTLGFKANSHLRAALAALGEMAAELCG